ncbi:hypothetical protein [Thalassotalea castellviae]|uniref:Glycosyltransferase subfamily 4-like N-terminal domain-containing protein n=1 Tax=Thalassotalea castellviae TaxID=3075612 RepID=A0ABU3A0U6_9GAMM|nr:hypothetical protein [Thalassotalea sp. W431]MDT0603802.1 hypothetical protein [Thalassotalea sp. W431]
MARILFVTSEYEPFQASGVNRIKFFKKSLEQRGHIVIVLTTCTSAQGLKRDRYKDHRDNIYRAVSLSLLGRRLLSSRRLPIYPTISRTGKYSVWIPFAILKGQSLVNKFNIDTIITSFPDFASLNVAEKVATKAQCRLITDFRDPPFWIYDQISKVDRKIKKCQEIVHYALKRSSDVITCTEYSAAALSDYYNLNYNNVVIANGYDQDIIDKIPSKVTLHKNYFELIHIGSFYDEGRDIRPVVKALEQFIKSTEAPLKLKLRLIGDKPDRDTLNYLERFARSFEVIVEPPVPITEALTIAKSSDALLLLQGSRFDRQIPTKVYEYLALNRPIWSVVGAKGETRKLLENYPDNVVYSNYDCELDILNGVGDLLKIQAKTVNCDNLSRQAQIEQLTRLHL